MFFFLDDDDDEPSVLPPLLPLPFPLPLLLLPLLLPRPSSGLGTFIGVVVVEPAPYRETPPHDDSLPRPLSPLPPLP